MSVTDKRRNFDDLPLDLRAAREAAAWVRERTARLRPECEAAREAAEQTRAQVRRLRERIPRG